ncbi:MAG TPA: hypothetical protein VF412_07560 [Bdellovibrio sp.]|uniref:hypothetical protein n=1 Tax=Bdellovibrio sp. TaxID=28201 RepID=UPI002F09BE9E
MGRVVSLVVVLLFSCSGMAASSERIQKLVGEFEHFQVLKMLTRQGPQPLPDDPGHPYPNPQPPSQHQPPPQECPPSGGPVSKSCVEAVCNHLSPFDCNSQSGLADITRNCRNVSGVCVNSICNRVSHFDCDEKSELFTVTNMCRGVVDMSCVDYICSRLSYFDCNELDKLRKIVDQCR